MRWTRGLAAEQGRSKRQEGEGGGGEGGEVKHRSEVGRVVRVERGRMQVISAPPPPGCSKPCARSCSLPMRGAWCGVCVSATRRAAIGEQRRKRQGGKAAGAAEPPAGTPTLSQ